MVTLTPAQDPNNVANWTGYTLEDGSGGTLESSPASAGQDPPATAEPKRDNIASALAKGDMKADIAKEAETQNIADKARESSVRLHDAWNAEAATSRDIPSWNEQQQKEKFATDPVKAFGSVGSVFAMVAAAFTHRPMINALQGSAAAMDATREGDEKAYKEAYTAWKDNTELALKRHDMMRQEFEDAAKIGETDIAAAKAQQLLVAQKYDDKRAVFLLSNGLNEDYLKLRKMQDDSAEASRKHVNSIIEDTFAKTAHDSMAGNIEKAFDGRPKDDPQRLGLMAEADRRYIQTLQGGKTTEMEDQQFRTIVQWEMEHAKDNNGAGPKAEDRQKFLQGFLIRYSAASAAGGAPKTVAAQKLDLFNKLQAAKAAHDTVAIAAIEQQINDLKDVNAPGVTGNNAIEQKRIIDQYSHAQDDLKQGLAFMDKYTLAAGKLGSAARGAEIFSNVLLKSSDTDRKQFERIDGRLKAEAARLETASKSRPLSAEEGGFMNTVGGFSFGDTTANVKRSFQDLLALYAKMQKEASDRLSGTWKDPTEGGASTVPPASKTAPWANDPEVQ